ncbi:hypothetical protein CPB97_000561 [Podila verticillata]|nr:hypothetical protein CPB97_000561 [Podila verticillata]
MPTLASPPTTPQDHRFTPKSPEDDQIIPTFPKSLPLFFHTHAPSTWLLEDYLKDNADMALFMRSQLVEFCTKNEFGEALVFSIAEFYKMPIDLETRAFRTLSETVRDRVGKHEDE